MMWKDYWQQRRQLLEDTLNELLPELKDDPLAEIMESMRYSLFAGGKRLRPLLLMAAADAVGSDGRRYVQAACAMEMIHTYSLIHDDLPAMDNDDFRRGRPTNHRVFGEGTAILAGDGLLTRAFETVLDQPDVAPEILIRVAREIAVAAGPIGMVGGQAIDLKAAGHFPAPELMAQMHRLKTGALFRAAVRSGALLAGALDEDVESLGRFADNFGLAFQITDDILDVIGNEATLGKPVGSDERNLKATYVTIYSLQEARVMAETAIAESLRAIDRFGSRAAVLRSLAEYLLLRDQ